MPNTVHERLYSSQAADVTISSSIDKPFDSGISVWPDTPEKSLGYNPLNDSPPRMDGRFFKARPLL